MNTLIRGNITPEQAEEIRKALEVGYGVAPYGLVPDNLARVGGSALAFESVDRTLKVLTYREENIIFWREIPKYKAQSPVEMYITLESYGAFGNAFWGEGITPQARDSVYRRRASFMKYMGVLKEVSLPAVITPMVVEDIVARENINGILWLLRQLEWSLFYGDSKLTPSGLSQDGLEFDGLATWSENKIDLKGNQLTEEVLKESAFMVQSAWGIPNRFYTNPAVIASFASNFTNAQRVLMPTPNTVSAGVVVDVYHTPAGKLLFRGDLFLQYATIKPEDVVEGQTQENFLSISAQPSHPATAQAPVNKWNAVNPSVSSVRYKVIAVAGDNVRGRVISNVVETNPFDITDNNNVVQFDIQLTRKTEYVYVFRMDNNSGRYGLIARVSHPDMVGTTPATITIVDRNERIPNTYDGFVFELSEQTMKFAQLHDAIKINLAVVSPAFRWIILLSGGLIVFAPKRVVHIKNIGV